MVATSAQVGFVTEQFRTVVASDTAVKTAYGEEARDTGQDVIETFFDTTTDAQAIATERFNLLKANRRRFRQEVNSILSFTGTLDFSQVTPAVNVIDDERLADHNAAIVEVGVRRGDSKTAIHTWG